MREANKMPFVTKSFAVHWLLRPHTFICARFQLMMSWKAMRWWWQAVSICGVDLVKLGLGLIQIIRLSRTWLIWQDTRASFNNALDLRTRYLAQIMHAYWAVSIFIQQLSIQQLLRLMFGFGRDKARLHQNLNRISKRFSLPGLVTVGFLAQSR